MAAHRTRREEIVSLIERGRYTPRELAAFMELRVTELLEDLGHVRKTLGKRFIVEPAVCRKCDFVFRKRDKLGTPSRCPSCRCERIDGPWLSAKREV